MLRWKRDRVPEGGAIDDSDQMSAEVYGQYMLRRLEDEYRRFAAVILERSRPPEGGRVLEIGPGPGWVSFFVGKERPDLEINAVDASPDMARACSANLSLGADRIVVGTAEQLGAAVQGEFDLIYSRDSLHHWIDPVAAFVQIRSFLRLGGTFVLSDERRDLSLFARLLVAVLSRRMGTMGKFWR